MTALPWSSSPSAGWAQFIPKEFYPVGGRPGITRLLEEIGGVGPARVVIVYHPYYEQFAAWARYAHEVPAAVPAGLSVLNGADHTGTAPGWIGIDWCRSPTRFALNFGSPARVSAVVPASCCYRCGVSLHPTS
jgi:hypothetical protein